MLEIFIGGMTIIIGIAAFVSSQKADSKKSDTILMAMVALLFAIFYFFL